MRWEVEAKDEEKEDGGDCPKLEVVFGAGAGSWYFALELTTVVCDSVGVEVR